MDDAGPAHGHSDYQDPAYGYQDPAYSYEAPAYEDPAYEAPAYEDPGYEAAGYEAAGYEAAGYEAAGYEAAGYEAAGYAVERDVSQSAREGALGAEERPRNGRTETLVSRGRRSAQSSWLSRRRLIVFAAGAGVVVILILILALSGNGGSWPASVSTVQAEIARACQNTDVASEPGQVNFACAKPTRQILWVFSLLTSNDNPHFSDPTTGRLGLEPITPSEGGEVAWSLNLHHPYAPDNPIDSLQVAARAINNIIGGATLTATGGGSVVQSGLEGSTANCLRYTGSAALRIRTGFPRVCARPVSSPAGQAALVADVYQKWIVGAGPRAAQNAAVLFENYNNPGDPQVQAVLRQLAHAPG